MRPTAPTRRTRTPGGSEPGLAHLDDELAEVLALKQADERSRGVFQAVDDVLAVLERSVLPPAGRPGEELAHQGVGELVLDEAADGQRLAQDRRHERARAVRARRRLGLVVVGDEPADGDARE